MKEERRGRNEGGEEMKKWKRKGDEGMKEERR